MPWTSLPARAKTITLPAGQFNTLQMLATGVQGHQTAQTFTVTYTDNSTATFTREFQRLGQPASLLRRKQAHHDALPEHEHRGSQAVNVSVDGYVCVLDETRTVKNIILSNNGNLIVLSLMLANDPVSVP